MNVYLVSQDVNTDYDTFDSFVVIAKNADQARLVHPSGWYSNGESINWERNKKEWADEGQFSSWVRGPGDVEVKKIGVTDLYNQPTMICTSFNAG